VADAVVIGSGPNGLVAANVLADAGWTVAVLESASVVGGAVRTGELTLPGFKHDLFSAFYPLAAASPVLRAFDLESHGLRWRRSPLVLADPARDGSCAVLSTDIDETADSLESFAPGDGEAWRALFRLFERVGDQLVDAMFTPFPPLRAGTRLAATLGPREFARFARFASLPVRRLAEEEFTGEGGGRLLAGNALHADLTPEIPPSGILGWLLSALGQRYGYPMPAGGAGELTGALARRLQAKGGVIETDARVTEVIVRARRAVGVRTADGRTLEAGRAVLAAVGAPALYLELVDRRHLPSRLLDDLRRFQYDSATFKVDWALAGPLPWSAPDARRAATVHVTESMDALSEQASQRVRGLLPACPSLVIGQYSTGDPTRSPAGTDTAWAYTHVPHRIKGDAGGQLTGSWDGHETESFAARVEAQIEQLAPGFRDLIKARHIFTPPAMEAANANLVGGALGGGTTQIHQQGPFRPTTWSLGRPETPVRALYLASASAHPGGGVHGAPGANAARAALRARRRGRTVIALGVGGGAIAATRSR